MRTFLGLMLWCFLFILCWPLALIILMLYPIIWLVLLPFRVVGLSVELLFKLLSAILLLPFKIVRAI